MPMADDTNQVLINSKWLQWRYWLKLVVYIQRHYLADGCSHSAAALTYMSLFALVPLLTVMYAILSAVPRHQPW